MGYGYPAALGAKVARPDKQVIDIDGDGSFLMNIQELATAHVEKIAAKAIILEQPAPRHGRAMGDNFYAGNRGHTYLGNPEDRSRSILITSASANGFNVPCERVMFKRDLPRRLQRMLDSKEPYVLDVVTLRRTRAAFHSRRPNRRRHDLEARKIIRPGLRRGRP